MTDLLKFMHCGCEYNFCSSKPSPYPEEIFGDGSDGNCVIENNTSTCGNIFLPVGEYNFNNLTICEGVKLRFCGEGVPIIRVKENFVNDGCIILRNPLVCENYTFYEPLLGKQITTTKNDCYDCALTTYNCIYDRVGNPECRGGGAGGGQCNNGNAHTGAGGKGGGAGNSGCDGCAGTGSGGSASCGGAGGAGGTSAYANAGGGGGGGGAASRCNYIQVSNGYAGCPAEGDGIGGRGGDGGNGSYNPECYTAGGSGGGGGFGYYKGGDGGNGGKSGTNIGGNYYSCLNARGGNGGDSYMGTGGKGGCGFWRGDNSGYSGASGGDGGWSYYGDGGQGGHGGEGTGNGGWSMFGNGGAGGGTSGSPSYRGGTSIYGNAGNGKTKGNGISGGVISWGGSYGLGLFTKNFCLSGQIWGPGFSGTSYSSKSSNIYIVTGRDYICNGCICNTGGSCSGKLFIVNTCY